MSFSFCSYRITYTTIPKGAFLYRSADNICPYEKSHLRRRECPDTGKKGVYFSTYVFQSLAMAIEYGADLELGVFKTTAPIKVMDGKYHFRFLHPERYFRKDGSFITNVDVRRDENVSHIEQTYPLIDMKKNVLFDKDLDPKNGEVFIASPEDLKKVKLLKTYRFSVDGLKIFLKAVKKENNNCIPLLNNTLYLRSGILKPLDCAKEKTNKTRKNKYKDMK
jgi:hypothetical protein